MRKSVDQILEEVMEKVGAHAVLVEENRKDVYKLSRKLSSDDGYKLIRLFESTVSNITEAYSKVNK